MKPRGRFVAGATCPRCAAVDRVKVDVDTGLRRWCIACDFDETLAPDGALPATSSAPSATLVRVFGFDSRGSESESS